MLSLIVMAALSTAAAPKGDLVKTVSHSNNSYRFYLLQDEAGRKQFKVCVRYRPTGTKIRRNSCSSPTPFNVVSRGPLLHPFYGFDPQLGYESQAAQLAEVANELLLKDNVLTKKEIAQLRSIVHESFTRTLPFNPGITR